MSVCKWGISDRENKRRLLEIQDMEYQCNVRYYKECSKVVTYKKEDSFDNEKKENKA